MEDLDKAGVTYTKEKLCTIMGGNMLVHVKLMDEAFGDQDNYRKNREEINRRKYRKYDLKALKSPHVTELMEKLQENNIKICVCSNSEKARNKLSRRIRVNKLCYRCIWRYRLWSYKTRSIHLYTSNER